MSTNGRGPALFGYLLRLADDRLVLGHRLSEWCGHAPILEEELALGNVALDLIGQAAALLGRAGEIEGRGRSADELAFFREAIDFRNCVLVEQPNGDFACTIVRQVFFDVFDVGLTSALSGSSDEWLASWARKACDESRYHLRHSREWTLRLGAGTGESRSRIERALGELWPLAAGLFEEDDVEEALARERVAVRAESLRAGWRADLGALLAEANLALPQLEPPTFRGGRTGVHSEHLGHLLSEMQILARSFPGADW